SVVVLVPGYTGSKEDFGPIASAVVSAGRRFVALDQRGQHQSPGPDDPSAYGVEALADDLLDLRSALGQRVAHLVGHSFGGLVARAAVLRDPSAYASLTMMGSGPAAIGGASAERVRALRMLMQRMTLDEIARLTDDDPVNAARPADVRDFLRQRFVGTAAASFDGMGEAILTEPDRVGELRATGVRVLVMHGEHDDVWLPQVQAEMASRLRASYAVLLGAAHSPAVESPEETARVLAEFWDAVEVEVTG
ncbi:MAG TPA: alpha/beta hydrolase, partial [Mycobacteriales bacterium]|nr:alpha/beta hydrolase [Mycobacteriales bacterium]